MTAQETQKLLRILAAAYPRHFRTMSDSEKWAQVKLYWDMFGEYPESIVAAALQNYIRVNEYPPTIAGLTKEINLLKAVTSGDTIEKYKKEAWSAVIGSKRFGELSDPLREYFGSQQTIDAIGQDENTIYTVFAAQLEKRLPEILARQKAKAEMDPVIENAINQMLKAGRAGQDPEALPGTGP